jgi:rhamnulokinase
VSTAPISEQHAALVAVDLGAESCRVSLLSWVDRKPHITVVHRFPNAPRTVGDEGSLHWDLKMVEDGVWLGLERAAKMAPQGIRSIAVDGWGVDYVRLGNDGLPLADPYCYRDIRTVAAEDYLHRHISAARMHEITAVTALRINTLYQLHADRLTNMPAGRGWIQLPEYLLYRLGGRPVSERTLAAHTQLVDVDKGTWSPEIFTAADLDISKAPEIVEPGTDVGQLSGPLAELPAYKATRLIAPATHDTASAIAGIPAVGDDWAYISSGTWSLVGALVKKPIRTAQAMAEGFTNLAGAGGLTCFHVNVNGMWLLRQSMVEWEKAGREFDVGWLVAEAEKQSAPAAIFHRINTSLQRAGHAPLDESPEAAPAFANVIFHSLAARYKQVLENISGHTGKRLKRVFIVGGGSRNQYLNRLIAERTGFSVHCGSAESSTIGNFAIQMAVLAGHEAPSAEVISEYATELADTPIQTA